MRAKEKVRLDVLRSLLSEITNSTKSPTSNHTGPITDSVVLKYMQKALQTAQTSLADYTAAGRQDLMDKQEGQIKVLQEYLAMVKVASKEDIEKVVEAVIKVAKEEGKGVFGEVMKETLKRLEGRNAVPRVVSEVVREALAKL
ncbi:GatB/YqeY domain-containing protein [Ascobolus immersus RN42]|uniref:Altered inheritance of mitochondria protein 41 n=1 Tax=Ascobolus immersus RN42 TaxID=1160509 RepID=A0A3N4H8X7_ASCIM|nr:GatB/YqeY domain-containing protein [Ascobolus immersus RN42]